MERFTGVLGLLAVLLLCWLLSTDRKAIQPRVLKGRLGKGGAPIRLGTVNGAIRVVALRSTI